MSMTPQEQDTLSRFLSQLTTVPAPQTDAQAENLIRDAFVKQPHAAYLVVQRAILLEQALNAEKAQVAQLQSQLQAHPSASGGSFLGGGNPWSPTARPVPALAAVPGSGQYTVPSQAPASIGNGFLGGGTSGFLGNVATTAAGVVAGSFLFQGIENLMGHHQSGGWFSGNTPMAGPVAEETTINNYYDGSPDGQYAQTGDDGFLASDDSGYGDDDSSWV
jgi:uncharacterized protein